MKKCDRIGKIGCSDLKSLPEKHERATAWYFANRGRNVDFLRPSSVKGTHSPDFAMDGKIWEIKSPITYSDSSFEYNFKKAMKQSSHIVFDLRRLSVLNERNYIKELQKWCKTPTIRTLLVITRDGRVLTLRGKFSII